MSVTTVSYVGEGLIDLVHNPVFVKWPVSIMRWWGSAFTLLTLVLGFDSNRQVVGNTDLIGFKFLTVWVLLIGGALNFKSN